MRRAISGQIRQMANFAADLPPPEADLREKILEISRQLAGEQQWQIKRLTSIQMAALQVQSYELSAVPSPV